MTIKACAVCGRVLDRIGGSDGEWMHTHELVGFPDHIAVPVDYDAIPVEVLCDFCYAPIPDGQVTTIPARPFDLPDGQSRSMGNWAACVPCARLIEKNRWADVRRRAAEGATSELRRLGERPMPAAALRDYLRELYGELRRHITGPPRPWQVGDEKDVEA